ncbi:MAG: hypothetical protein LBE10_12985 [Treponema sp.]|jgi:hypothetical protein|nr:hypothetical protein [Treponema sp.]
MMMAVQEFVLEETELDTAGPEIFPESFDAVLLRQKINDEEYLNDAIQRIALILANELLDISPGGTFNGRQRKRR